MQHSLEVVDVAVYDSVLLPCWGKIKPNADILIAGGLLHDIGKVFEYVKIGSDFTYESYSHLLGHIPLGFDYVSKKIQEIKDFPKELSVMIFHIILSHHGKKEWGSPVIPYTIEAELIHLADHKSASAQLWINAYGQSPLPGESFVRADKLKSSEAKVFGRNVFAQHDEINKLFEE